MGLHMKIPLTNSNKTFLIDGESYHEISKVNWFLNNGYVSRTIYIDGNPYQQRLHRQLLKLEPYNLLTGDHINGDKLDNRRSNLRVCTQGQNNRNSVARATNKSGFKGVSWKKSAKKWCAQIMADRVIHIGVFKDKEYAAYLYDQYALQLHGDFARTNYEY